MASCSSPPLSPPRRHGTRTRDSEVTCTRRRRARVDLGRSNVDSRPVAVVLGCKYDSPRARPTCPDHVRLDALSDAYPGLRVLGCTEFSPPATCHGGAVTHVSAHFRRSLDDVLAVAPSVLLLDYFWLERGYYEHAYGMNWLSSKLRSAFAPSSPVQLMILPVDRGDANNIVDDASGGCIARMRAGMPPLPPGVTIEYVHDDDALIHPLVKATLRCDDALRTLAETHAHAHGRCHEGQIHRLSRASPFLVVRRTECEWRGWLGRLGSSPARAARKLGF